MLNEELIRKRLAAILVYLENQEKYTVQDDLIGLAQEDYYLKGCKDTLLYVLEVQE